MNSNNLIDRESYRKIKKMSREELQTFLIRYAEGLLEDNDKTIDLPQIKGIGEKRLEEVMAVIEKHLDV